MPAIPSKQDYYELLGNSNSKVKPALEFAQKQCTEGLGGWNDECQKFVREALGCPGGVATALLDWEGCPESKRHSWYFPPVGVPVFWGGGTMGDGHVALSNGNGKVWSTDILRKGEVDLVEVQFIKNRWNLPYLGWTEECNGVTVYTDPNAVVESKTSTKKDETE